MPPQSNSLFAELKRRNVIRVGIAYILVAWIIAQVAELALDSFNAPDWVIQAVLVLLALGLPLALFFAWAFEMTPEGIKKEKNVDRSVPPTHGTRRKLDVMIIAVLSVGLAYFAVDKFLIDTTQEPKQSLLPVVTAKASIAVLPFVNMSSDAEQEHFSDGITEEILNTLVKLKGLKVAGRTSSFAFKGRNEDLRAIGETLSVEHILEGSVRRAGKRLRITAQLVQVKDGFHVWSDTFDRELDDVFAIQEEIAEAIGDVLAVELGVGTRAPRTSSIESYDNYLKGRALLRKRENLEQASDYFRQVTEEDPEFAPAWAGWAITRQVMEGDSRYNDEALELARQALSIDPDNVDALNALAAVLRDRWQWTEAEATFEHALSVDPQSAELLEDYSEFLAMTGRSDEQLVIAERGYALDPLHGPMTWTYVEALVAAGQRLEAVAIADAFAEQSKTLASYWYAAMMRLHYGESLTAIGYFERAGVPKEHGDTLTQLVRQTQINDRNDAVIKSVRNLMLSNAPGDLGWDSVETEWINRSAAQVLLYAGDVDLLIETDLEYFKTFAYGNTETLFLPALNKIRQHPRFIEYLNLLKLPAYWDSTSWPRYCRRSEASIVCE